MVDIPEPLTEHEIAADGRLRRLIGELHLTGATPGTKPVTEGDSRVFRATMVRRGAQVDAVVSTLLYPGTKLVTVTMTVVLP